LKVSWGVGAVVAVLVSAAVLSFGLLNPERSLSLALMLLGLWTIVSAFTVAQSKDRGYYSAWGVVLAMMSLFAYLPANYALGLLFIGVVVLILINLYWGRTEKVITAAQAVTPAPKDTPAANST
jgi:cell division protein FtsW (lipid II flippase)